MNVSSESTTHKPGSSSTRTTTLYDLMAEINASTCGTELGNIICDIQEPAGNSQNSPMAEKVARMFESGQIRFMNIQDVKRKYADWLI
jgi:hypothetical protein